MALKSVESRNVEFKASWRDEYLKVICAFANADGGKLIIGIDDKGNPITIVLKIMGINLIMRV